MPHFFSSDANQSREMLSAKRKLREAMLLKRQQVPHVAMLSASESVARHFADHPILSFAASFAGYRAVRGELDVMPVFTMMRRYEKAMGLPRMVAKDAPLVFHHWQPGASLTRHMLGIEEPSAEQEILVPEVVLVPLLAFDGDGYRLGYGAGFYDRTMQALREAPTPPPLFIGVAYSMQEVEHVPAGEHDQPLDGIITEHGVSIFNSLHPRVVL